VKVGWWANSLVLAKDSDIVMEGMTSTTATAPQEEILFAVPLRGTQRTQDCKVADRLAIGGLRGAAEAVDRLSHARAAGQKSRAQLDALFDERPDIEQAGVAAIGSEDPDAGPNNEQLRAARECMAAAVGAKSAVPLAGAWRIAVLHCR
jgi:hypothetical protein